MVNFVVNKLRKYGIYDSEFINFLKRNALKILGRNMKKFGIPCLKKIDEVMSENGYNYWVDFGTLLGIYRDGNLIKHDFDIDIGLKKVEFNSGLEKVLIKNGFKKIKEYSAFGEIVEQTWVWNGVHIDLFLYEEDNNSIFAYDFYTNDEAIYVKVNKNIRKCTNLQARVCYVPKVNVKKINFKDFMVNVPENTHEYLEANYGPNFMTPDDKWDSSLAPNIKNVDNIEMETLIFKG